MNDIKSVLMFSENDGLSTIVEACYLVRAFHEKTR